MLIKALCDYYDVLASQGKVLPQGYSEISVRYLISLTAEGTIDDIIDWQEKTVYKDKKGKEKEKLIPRTIRIFKRTEKTCISSNFIEHRPLYIFGNNWASKDNDKDSEKAKKSHHDFIKVNLDFIKGIDTPIVNAYRNFIERWNPDEQLDNPILKNVGKQFLTAGYAFCLSGHPEILLHEDEVLCEKWLRMNSEKSDITDIAQAQCSILGQMDNISRIHNKIRGFNAMGSALVNFNNPCDSSYGKKQSFNSSISETAMVKYTEAMNYLLSNNKHRSTIGDTTVIHWAESGDERCDDFVSDFLFDNPDKMNAEETTDALKDFLKKLKSGKINQSTVDEFEKSIDDSVNYYMVGLKPNASRIAVKFLYRQKFGDLVNNMIQHQKDLCINDNGKTVSLWKIEKELIPPKTSNPDYDPALTGQLMNSVTNGYMYPYSLLAKVIQRIKNDSDDEKNQFIKMNDVRIGIIKAYLNRKSRINNRKEEIKMALDMENKNQAYLCGRLFAVLEYIQQKASGNNLNRTIRDTYFSTAAAHPAVVFPRIMKLSQYHLAKLDNPHYWNNEICNIVDMLGNEFPASLNLTEQGKFMIGYYQQKNHKKTKKESE